jgi:hypothetical protein
MPRVRYGTSSNLGCTDRYMLLFYSKNEDVANGTEILHNYDVESEIKTK